MRRTSFFLACLICGVAAVALALFTPQPMRLQAYLDYSVAWAALSLLAFVGIAGVCVWRLRLSDPAHRRGLWIDLLVAALITTAICVLVPARSFIENDENNVIGAAQAIRFLHAPTSVLSGYVDATGALVPLDLGLDKRGVMYPLMLALIAPHAVGFNQAPYVVNAAAGLLLLFLLLRIVRRVLPGPAAIAAPLLLACFPVFTISMRGGTFDVVNSAFLLLLVHVAAGWLKIPSRSRLLLFAATAAVLAQIRLESVLVVTVVTMIVVIAAWTRQSPQWRHPLLAIISLLIAPALLRMAVPIDYEMPGPWFQPWAARNMPDNIERVLAWLWSPSGMDTGNPLIGLLVLLAVILQLARRQFRPTQPGLAVLILIPALALTTLLMVSYWGQVSQLITARYFIYLAAIIAGASAVTLHGLVKPLARTHAGAITIGMAATLFCFDIQRSIAAEKFDQLSLHRYRDAVREAIDDAYGHCNVLVATINSPMLVTQGIGAVLPARLRDLAGQTPQFPQSNGIHAIALALEVRADETPNIGLLQELRAHTLIAEHMIGATGARIYQIWPEPGQVVTRCEDGHRALANIRQPGTPPPRNTWESFVERWSAEDPGLKMLMNGIESREPADTNHQTTTR